MRVTVLLVLVMVMGHVGGGRDDPSRAVLGASQWSVSGMLKLSLRDIEREERY